MSRQYFIFGGKAGLTGKEYEKPKIYFPKDKKELKKILEELIEERGNDGDFNDIDTSKITDMSGLFFGKKLFNGDISQWDVSNVTNMEGMFVGTKLEDGEPIWYTKYFMNPTEENLCIDIARCTNIGVNPCHTIQSAQDNCILKQIPEPWSGHLSKAQIMFIGANPSIDFDEKFPTIGWQDKDICDFFDNRFVYGKISKSTGQREDVRYWTELLKYTYWIILALKCNNAFQKNINIPESLLQKITKIQESRDSILKEIKRNDIYFDLQRLIVSTEIVHCKSLNQSYYTEECEKHCFKKWMGKILNEYNGKLIVLLGDTAQNFYSEIQKSTKGTIPIIKLQHPTSNRRGLTDKEKKKNINDEIKNILANQSRG